MKIRKIILYLLCTVSFLSSYVFSNENNQSSVKNFVSRHNDSVIGYLESYQSEGWSKDKVKAFIDLSYDEWVLIKSEIEPFQDFEKPFWCGLKSLSQSIDGVGSKKLIETFISTSLDALKNNHFMEGDWICERWDVAPKQVSIINLIATPMEYHNQLISVVGVGKSEFESDALYLSKEHYKYGLSKNGIWLHLNPVQVGKNIDELIKGNGKYILVEGRFDGQCEGHRNLWSGCFEYVTRYDIIE